jgi:UDP-2,4-diacetamido-2,4,6-trideoxy-beta-L-altropyranose hydrolase
MSKFLFRCDVAPKVGAGHLNRCTVLAKELKDLGSSVYFALRCADFEIPKDLLSICDGLTELDWSVNPKDDLQEVIRLYRANRINTAIIDHYRASPEYQKKLYESGVRWLQFDGCNQQSLWADVVLNPSLAADECDYSSITQRDDTLLLLGPKYAMLRREFARWQPKVRFRKQEKKILLTFGGGDDRGATLFALEATKSLNPDIERVIIVSAVNPRIADIENWMRNNSNIATTLLVDERKIAKIMAEADISITAGGTTTLETAAMGLPTLIVQIADNQKRNAEGCQKEGVAIDLGTIDALDRQTLAEQTVKLISDVKLRERMSSLGRHLVDCLGAHRVAQILLTRYN